MQFALIILQYGTDMFCTINHIYTNILIIAFIIGLVFICIYCYKNFVVFTIIMYYFILATFTSWISYKYKNNDYMINKVFSYLKTDEYLQLIEKIEEAVNYKDPALREFALKNIKHNYFEKHPSSRNNTQRQTINIYKQIEPKWKYCFDPTNEEYFATASESTASLSGDCDDFAILMAAVIKAVGGKARICLTYNHAYCEMFMGYEEELDDLMDEFKTNGKDIFVHQNGKLYLNMDFKQYNPGDTKHDVEDVEDFIYLD